MYKPGDTSFIRVKHEDIQSKLNEGYVFGSPIQPPNKGKKQGPSKKRRKVTDGIEIYDSLIEAGNAYGVSKSSICHWCKDPTKANWSYVID